MPDTHEIRPGQSIELLKALHILTRDGKMNQDSRRKLKQVYHLFQFIEPLLKSLKEDGRDISLVDHGAGKSYLGFILYDLFFKDLHDRSHIYGIETREALVVHTRELAQRLGFAGGMSFLNLSVAEATESPELPATVDIVTALHACDTATDDAIRFALRKQARYIVVVPCCQAEVAAALRRTKQQTMRDPLSEIWRHPLHTREFGSQVTNVLRCLQLEAHGYQVSVTELVGWEHSMKNELIIAQRKNAPQRRAAERLNAMLERIGLQELKSRFFAPEELAGADTHAA
ncbi:class I SAM-dependent methyltransferase [Bordetella bronchialis]|uniref:SAM-dependent methyltransferase n=1 Tax=Bordetella bronchialis TaxID=463025 RepID=A0ABM6D076_9BORD|nr:SAM-dependent methyltransferase [Bordetella bronchialis]ANN69702.1 SAM-dependent methyltransferase [Bordetella bronchialis]